MGASLSKSKRKRSESKLELCGVALIPRPQTVYEEVEVKKKNEEVVSNVKQVKDIPVTIILNFDGESLEIHENDSFSHSTMDIICIIFSYLSIREIFMVQQISRFWFNIGTYNRLWKDIVRRESIQWTSKDYILKILAEDTCKEITWRDIARDYSKTRACKKCNGSFQRGKNSHNACISHTGIRDLVEGILFNDHIVPCMACYLFDCTR